uniref:GTP cyclohydrolase I n=1 Tax=viral metagenome TaxID=1070528 RepID=A0A6M3JKS8_9ZZZZ
MNNKKLQTHITAILELIGEDPKREGLKDTPKRVAKAYREWFKGYTTPPNYKLFKSNYKGILARKEIPFISHCEHHISIYTGFINFGYIPNGKVTGISKIIRRFQHLSSRLTIQENLTDLLIDDFIEEIKPKGAIITLSACHTCEGTRGIKVPNVPTITSSVRGVFEKDTSARQEFFELIK